MAVIIEKFFQESNERLRTLRGYSQLKKDYARIIKAKAPDIANDTLSKRILSGEYDGIDLNCTMTHLFRKFVKANTDFIDDGGRH